MFKISVEKQKDTVEVSGVRYGLYFVQGKAVTNDAYLAKRLGNKKGFKSEEVTLAQAKKTNCVITEAVEAEAKAIEATNK